MVFLDLGPGFFLKNSEILMLSLLSFKAENILKGSLDLISSPSPSVKIQIMDGKVCLRCKGKRQNIAGRYQQTFEDKNFVDITQQCFALLPQVNFPTHNLNIH